MEQGETQKMVNSVLGEAHDGELFPEYRLSDNLLYDDGCLLSRISIRGRDFACATLQVMRAVMIMVRSFSMMRYPVLWMWLSR